MVKCTFLSGIQCFIASTNNETFIAQLQSQIGQTKWVIGILREGTFDNICNSTTRNWHYETFTGFETVTIEECETTIDLVEQYPSQWLYRNNATCIGGRLMSIEEDISCPTDLLSTLIIST